MEMRTDAQLDHRHLWHPFTQQQDWLAEEPLMIEGAEGCELIDAEGNRYLDGVSSLWCNVHGHRHPLIDRAVRDQLERVAHTTMLGLSHPRAAELAARLVAIAPPGLNRVFYSDSGSTAVEVALKMAFQYWQHRGGQHVRRTSYICLREAYHGDTVGSVSVGGIDLFHSAFGPLLFEAHRAEPGDIDEMARLLARHEEELAAVIVEPLVQGAAGIRTHPPGYLRAVRELTERHGVLLICDEVATGFGRTGTMFASEQCGLRPDLLCLGKALTAGYLPMSATAASERVYATFLGPDLGERTLYHGHSYSGNALAAAVALRHLELLESGAVLANVRARSDELRGLLDDRVAPLPAVHEVRLQGLMGGVELAPPRDGLRWGRRVCAAAVERGVLIRPLGDVVVLMPPLTITSEEVHRIVHVLADAVHEVTAP
jgi:adenosylmethionine-8-amino-7-oxononanoate aminotransferase